MVCYVVVCVVAVEVLQLVICAWIVGGVDFPWMVAGLVFGIGKLNYGCLGYDVWVCVCVLIGGLVYCRWLLWVGLLVLVWVWAQLCVGVPGWSVLCLRFWVFGLL